MRLVLHDATLHMRDALRAQGYGDLRPVHLLVVERLSRSAGRATVLARALNLTKQATGQIVDRMEALGYLERVADPVDGRAKVIALTPRGRQAATAMQSIADHIDAEWAKTLGSSRYRQLLVTLDSLLARSPP